MRLVTNVNHFTLGQKIDVVDDDNNIAFSTVCSMADMENVIESLCGKYQINEVYLGGAKNFTKKIENDLSRRTTFDKFNIKIVTI